MCCSYEHVLLISSFAERSGTTYAALALIGLQVYYLYE